MLQDVDIPEVYVDLFDQYSINQLVPLGNLHDLMGNAHISEHDTETIMTLLLTSDSAQSGLSRALTNLALCLIALAQLKEELSLDNVDDRKKQGLPIPKLDRLDKSNGTNAGGSKSSAIAQSQASDGHSDSQQTTLDSYVTRTVQEDHLEPSATSVDNNAARKTQDIDPWSPAGSVSHTPHYETNEQTNSTTRVYQADANRGSLAIDSITVRALEGKEGLPLWKHINYE